MPSQTAEVDTGHQIDLSLESLGFTADERADFQAAWDSYEAIPGLPMPDTAEGRYLSREASLRTLSELSGESFHMPRALDGTSRIRHFGRYSAATLLHQQVRFESGQQTEEPPVLVVSATGDCGRQLRELETWFEIDGPPPIFCEASTAEEVDRALLETSDRWGPIGTVAVVAHSDGNSLILNNRNRITARDITQSEALSCASQGDVFTSRAKAIFIACSSGKKGGFGQIFSEVTGMHVIAPLTPTTGRIRPDEDKPGYHTVIFNDVLARTLLDIIEERGVSLNGIPINTNVATAYQAGKPVPAQSLRLTE